MDEKVLFRTESRSLYSAAEMKKIENVIRIFYNYLRDNKRCELLWSDKVGYVLLPINRAKNAPAEASRVIRNAGELVSSILEEISNEVAYEAGKKRLTRKEYPEFRRRTQDYIVQLSEYAEHVPYALRVG